MVTVVKVQLNLQALLLTLLPAGTTIGYAVENGRMLAHFQLNRTLTALEQTALQTAAPNHLRLSFEEETGV